MTNTETNRQNETILALSQHRFMLVWRQMVGNFRAMYSNAIIKVGFTGWSDIGGIVPVVVTPEMVGKTVGIAVQIEMKVSKKKGSAEQETWGKQVRNRGGIYFVARSDVEAIERLDAEIKRIQSDER